MIAKKYFIPKITIGVICPHCAQFAYIDNIVVKPGEKGFILDYELDMKCPFCHLDFKIIIKKKYGGINL